MTLLCLSPRSKGFFQPFSFPRTKVLPYADQVPTAFNQNEGLPHLPLMENRRVEEERQLSSIPRYEISQISQIESVMIFSLGGVQLQVCQWCCKENWRFEFVDGGLWSSNSKKRHIGRAGNLRRLENWYWYVWWDAIFGRKQFLKISTSSNTYLL